VFVALVLVAGCRPGQTGGGLSSNPGAAASPKSAPNSPPGVLAVTPAAVAATERLLPTTPPPAFTYAGLLFTLKKGVISTVAAAGDPNMTLTLVAENPTKDGISISAGQLQVKLGDGTVAQAPFSPSVGARDSEESEIGFKVPATATWSGAQLSFNELQKEPAVLPLDGPVPPTPYPAKLTALGEAKVPDAQMTYTLRGGSTDLDAGGKRVGLGQRYVILSVHVSTAYPPGYAVGSDNFRLVVNGVSKAPEAIDPCCEVVLPGKDKDFQMAFAVPAAAAAGELEVGEAGKGTAKISLSLKAG